ncbi:formate/nitrite transporter family protein [Novosphingobium beihaiensis]|uniref:Formate/nitrite transporter family protein n=1 Tax=Novosphingobium beihaiensis TaxID=2930389 RepID=A0ABT0BV58_9SPHN|nr:formate/nitrite transporter family protein [Novosphingobium beihaiensis]MCJ2188953.1 formate/nitrite transporter family protein [Novosphingobium beihaiensis]
MHDSASASEGASRKPSRPQAEDGEKAEQKAEQKAEREIAEREIEGSAATLTRKERRRVSEHSRLSALTVFSVIRREGEEELRRPASSLWWSGIAAGIGISSSVYAQALLFHAFAAHPHRDLIASLGYSVGFVLVILSRLQLFTENTLSVVLPMLSEPSWTRLGLSARLWGVVLTANFIGTFLTASMVLMLTGTGDGGHSGHVTAMLEVSRHAAEASGMTALVKGIPAGFFIAALVWMLPSSKGFELWVIVLFTALIAAGGFTHVIAGSAEMFLLVVGGEMSMGAALLDHLLPTFAGNVIGGTGLFAMLAYGQIHAEI